MTRTAAPRWQSARLIGLALSLITLAALTTASAEARPFYRHCAYSTGKQSPQVRSLLSHGLACGSARKVISAVRASDDDWRGAYFSDTWGYVSYSTGGYDADGYLNEREFRCDYRLRGLTSKYVLVSCRDRKNGHVTVSAQLHGR